MTAPRAIRTERAAWRAGRLRSRPDDAAVVPRATLAPGEHALGLAEPRDGLVRVPYGYRADRPAPLVLALHGAGGDAAGGLHPLGDLADDAGLVLLAPDSRADTWDAIRGGFGPDVAFIDAALRWTFARLAIDPARVAVEGFSDGASYALSLALANGDLFRDAVAFSPGFIRPAPRVGEPRCFISHGTHDPVLPIDRCSRRIVPALAEAGYDVRYEEFDGGHTVPASVAQRAIAWLEAMTR